MWWNESDGLGLGVEDDDEAAEGIWGSRWKQRDVLGCYKAVDLFAEFSSGLENLLQINLAIDIVCQYEQCEVVVTFDRVSCEQVERILWLVQQFS